MLGNSRTKLTKLCRSCLLAFVAWFGMGSASVLVAQEPEAAGGAGRTHVVKKGDTLWDIARTYLSDPFQWPEIYRLNTAVVEDPHWIYPGEVLTLPGGTAGGEGIVVLEPGDPAAEAAADERPHGPTIFSRSIASAAKVSVRSAPPVQQPRTAVRSGEFYAAPWIDRRKGPARQGQILGSTELAGIAQASNRGRMQHQERVYVTRPGGTAGAIGERYVVISLGPETGRDGQIVIPTGVVEVESTDSAGVSTVRVVHQFDEIRAGQGVMQLEQFAMPADVRPAPVSDGPRATVVWIPSQAVLPSVQHYVLLDAASSTGVKIGDQFTLYRARVRSDEGHVLPEEKIALLQVVRVTERGTTGLVVDHKQPAIKPGAMARLTARMP